MTNSDKSMSMSPLPKENNNGNKEKNRRSRSVSSSRLVPFFIFPSFSSHSLEHIANKISQF